MKYNYIIYHRNCFDGYTGFYLFTKSHQFEPKPVVYADIPSARSPPPGIDGKRVIVIDVAYRPAIVAEIAARAEKLLFLDHHQTIEQEVADLKLGPPHEIVYRIDRCGATLVWDYFFADKPRPKFLEYIEDNDLGRWKIPETEPFIAALEVKHRLKPDFDSLKQWDQLLDSDYVDRLVETGRGYQEYRNFLIEKKVSRAQRFLFPSRKLIELMQLPEKQYRVAVLNGGEPSVSLVGRQMVHQIDCDFALIWHYRMGRNAVAVSLRSRSTDVGAIAKSLGGGGHKLASGFTIKLKGPPAMMFDSLEETPLDLPDSRT